MIVMKLSADERNNDKVKQLAIDGCVYQIHPIYDLYAASRDGKIVHIVRQAPNIGNKNIVTGYLQIWG